MEESSLILADLFGDRRPPPGPLVEDMARADQDHSSSDEPASGPTGEVQEAASPTLVRSLAPPPVVGDRVVDEEWRGRDLLPPLSPAPPMAVRPRTKASIAELARMLAPAVALLSLSKGDGTMSVAEIWDSVPQPRPNYESHNAIGDALGHGRGGHALRLRRGPRRRIVICQENATACMRRMDDAEIRNLAERLGFANREQLLAAFDALPRAES